MTIKGIIDEYSSSIENNLPPQGIGSVGNSVLAAGTVDYFINLVKRLNITSVSDCPCGLYENWVHHVNLPGLGIKYCGYDINNLAIERNKSKYSFLDFIEFNLYEEILPQSDLIICRDCLFHLPNDLIIRAIENFIKSKSEYLLATEHRWVQQNKNLTQRELVGEWGYREINLEIEPFNLGLPIEFHDEKLWNRSISLWKLKQ